MLTVGCFGDSAEDRYRARELDRYLAKQAEAEAYAILIDQRANDIYRAKLESLPVAHHTSTFGTRILHLDDVIGDIYYGATNEGVALACAVRDKNEAEAGRLLIKLITDRLREQAHDEAEAE